MRRCMVYLLLNIGWILNEFSYDLKLKLKYWFSHKIYVKIQLKPSIFVRNLIFFFFKKYVYYLFFFLLFYHVYSIEYWFLNYILTIRLLKLNKIYTRLFKLSTFFFERSKITIQFIRKDNSIRQRFFSLKNNFPIQPTIFKLTTRQFRYKIHPNGTIYSTETSVHSNNSCQSKSFPNWLRIAQIALTSNQSEMEIIIRETATSS